MPETAYFGWTIRENAQLAAADPKKFTAIPPTGSRFHKKSYPSIEAAQHSIDRRFGSRPDRVDTTDVLLERMLSARRRERQLQQQLEAAQEETKAAVKAFMSHGRTELPEE